MTLLLLFWVYPIKYAHGFIVLCLLLSQHKFFVSWWRHQMESFCAWPALCVGNSPVTGEYQWHAALMFSLCPNKRFIKQSRGWWFETPSRSLWRHCKGTNLKRLATLSAGAIFTNSLDLRPDSRLGLDPDRVSLETQSRSKSSRIHKGKSSRLD